MEAQVFRRVERASHGREIVSAARSCGDVNKAVEAAVSRISRPISITAFRNVALFLKSLGEPGVVALVGLLAEPRSSVPTVILLEVLERSSFSFENLKFRKACIELSKHDHSNVRRNVARILPKFSILSRPGDKAMRDLMKDDNPQVARAAVSAMRRRKARL